MQGACSNQIVKCIVYSSDMEIGKNKLLEIEKEKNELGIVTTNSRLSKVHNEIQFSDGEEWIVVNPSLAARGYRWRKAWIDASNTSYSALIQIILPCGDLYKWEDEKFFNW